MAEVMVSIEPAMWAWVFAMMKKKKRANTCILACEIITSYRCNTRTPNATIPSIMTSIPPETNAILLQWEVLCGEFGWTFHASPQRRHTHKIEFSYLFCHVRAAEYLHLEGPVMNAGNEDCTGGWENNTGRWNGRCRCFVVFLSCVAIEHVTV